MKKGHNTKENEILDYIQRYHAMTTSEAMQLTGVSESTIRRLFIKLQQKGYVERVFGGVKEIPQVETYSYQDTVIKNVEQKKEIGAVAASMVNDHDFFYLDCGTTTRQMAKALAVRMREGSLRGILAVTNSIINLEILGPYCDIINAGGKYSCERKDVSGNISETFLQQFHFDKCFLGTDGFRFGHGFVSTSTTVSLLASAASKLSEESYVLMDSSKIGKNAVGIHCNMSNIKGIITDSEIDAENLQRFSELRMKIIVKKGR